VGLLPVEGATKPGACSWCTRPVELVWRLYPAAERIAGGYWSVERCPCFDRSVARQGGHGADLVAGLEETGRNPRKYRNGVPLPPR